MALTEARLLKHDFPVHGRIFYPYQTPKIGHPQTCVYPDVCLGIAHVSGKVPFSGQGLSPCRFLGANGADTLCICQTPCPESGTLPDTWAIPKLGLAKNHPWMLTTLGCSPPLDARELLTRGIPQPINCWGVPELILTIPVGSAKEALDPGIPQLRNFSTEEFLGSGVPGHPRVVSIQGWFLAGPINTLRGKHRSGGLVARAIRNAIRANRFARIIRNWHPYFYSASGRFARITRLSDSRESPDSRESCESIRANHATKSGGAQ